jgi:tetratricopeptide (TPR) repeat protein
MAESLRSLSRPARLASFYFAFFAYSAAYVAYFPLWLAWRGLGAAEIAFVLALRAECSRNLGDHEQAQDELARALQLDPHERQALFLQARIFREERSPEKAVPLLRGIIEQDPHDYPARYQLAQVLGQLGQATAAAEELAQAEQSRAWRDELQTLYREAMQNAADANVRDAIAGLCRRLGKDELAAVWAQAAAQCRRVVPRGKP